jgi:exopolysaccharide biosynthesis protein
LFKRFLLKIVILSFVIFNLTFVIAASAAATSLYRVRFASYPEKIRLVFDFGEGFSYETDESREKIVIRLKDTEAGPEIQNFHELNDLIVRYLQIEKDGEDLIATIPLTEPLEYNIFYLNDPPRLVVDFSRDFLNIVSGGTVAKGIEFLRVKQGSRDGRINASVLRIDPRNATIRPALAQRQDPNLIESFVSFINPWSEKRTANNFTLDKVGNMVEENEALAGINGTYFAYNGRPLGALIIDQELISFPLYDRTAFFIDEKGKAYIDNIFTTSYFILASGIRYEITGVNRGRGEKDVIMYTSAWGERTGTNLRGIEVVVSRSKITNINLSDSEIPKDGYVLSLSGPEVEYIHENMKVGEPIDTYIKIVPFATAPKSILQLVSGGPRLIKGGRLYVSKHEEKFKMDIAKGRAARTAIGITQQGELLLVTVDGLRRKSKRGKSGETSIGATLEELSNLMLSLGAVEAMNLDGGSSSTMVIDGQLVNEPTSGYQRRVSNALIVFPLN